MSTRYYNVSFLIEKSFCTLSLRHISSIPKKPQQLFFQMARLQVTSCRNLVFSNLFFHPAISNRNYVCLLFDIYFYFRYIFTLNFKLKVGYTADKKRVWHFSVNKNYCNKDIFSKINSEKEKRIASTKHFFFMLLKHAQCIKEVATWRCFMRRLLLKHFNWY